MPANALMQDWNLRPDGSVKIVWEDGHSQEFLSLADVKTHAFNCSAGLESREMAECMLILWFLARQPDGSNPNLVEGKRLTVDFSNANPIRVQ